MWVVKDTEEDKPIFTNRSLEACISVMKASNAKSKPKDGELFSTRYILVPAKSYK